MLRIMVFLYFLLTWVGLNAQNETREVAYTGVFKGDPLFVQNPYLPEKKAFCIESIIVNKRRLNLDYNRSALIIRFESMDQFTPVSIHIQYSDSTCVPILLNPEAIRFHNTFAFEEITISDSTVVWKTRGEREGASYIVEGVDKYGIWGEIDTIPSKGKYGGSTYVYYPIYEPQINKFRVLYVTDELRLYSHEVEHTIYAEPIKFKRVGNTLVLSRACNYTLRDRENNILVSGSGIEIDISGIKHGEYILYFNDDQVELFQKIDRVIKIEKKSNN